MKPIRLFTLKAMGLWCMAIAGCLIPTVSFAQTVGQPPVTVELAEARASTANPQIRIVIPDLKLCPGQEYDIPVYIEISDESTTIHSFTLGFRFPDYDILEPTGHISDVYEPLRTLGQIASVYGQTAVYNLPDHSLRLNWIQTDAKKPLRVKSGQLLFRFRVKYKKEGNTKIDFVGGRMWNDSRYFSCFTINARENSILDNCKLIPDPSKDWGSIQDTIIYTSANIRAGEPFNISIIPDTVMCIGNAIHFWAEGGERYEWKDVSGMEYVYPQSMDDPRDQKPLFKPQVPGRYTFECKIVDKQGCVGYLYTSCNVRDNSLFLEVPQDTMINKGSQAMSTVSFWNSPDHHYVVHWTPDDSMTRFDKTGLARQELFTAGIDIKRKLQTYNITKKLDRAQWITVSLKDDFCNLQMVQNVNVKGAPIDAEITLDPPYVCVVPGQANAGTPVHVSVRAHGGSGGHYQYKWSARNLDEDSYPRPVWMNDMAWITSKVLVFKSCEVRVDVFDYNGSNAATFYDTIYVVNAAPVSLAIEDKNPAVRSCEKVERTFVAKSVNAQNPKYEWYINDVEVLRTPDTFFTTSALKVGDKVHCVMKNSGTCVTNNELRSQIIYPPIDYPGYMTASVDYGNGNVNGVNPGEKVSLNISHRHTGDNFRLRWYSNDRTLVYDGKMRNPKTPGKTPEDTIFNHPVEVERTGYYDYYRAVITGSDRACLIDDSLTTGTVQNFATNLSPSKPAVAGTVYLVDAVEKGICEGDNFYAYARGIKYLPKEFRVVWYVQHMDQANRPTEPVAYYSTRSMEGNYGLHCGWMEDEYRTNEDFYRIQNWVLADFKISLTEGDKIHGGDSLYYEVQTKNSSGTVVTAKSPKKALKAFPSVYAYPDADFVADKDYNKSCEGEVFRFAPVSPSSDTIHYTWFVDGREIVPRQGSHTDSTSEESDDWTIGDMQKKIRQPEIQGDTLVLRLYNDMDIKMRATNSYHCYRAPSSRYSERVFTSFNMYAGFRIVRSNDTLICSGDTVALWAYGEPYRYKFGSIKKPTKPGVPEFLSDYESKIKMTWAYSKEELIADKTIDTGLSIKVTLDSAAFGDRSADYDNPDAVVGHQRYYLRMTNYESGCTSYDSVDVMVGYHRTPTIVVTPEPAFPWCEGEVGPHLKLSGTLWGSDTNLRIRIPSNLDYWFRVSRPDSVPYMSNVMKPGTVVEFKVNNPLSKSCNHQSESTVSVTMNIRNATKAYVRNVKRLEENHTATVCLGDPVTIEGVGATLGELQSLSGKRLTIDQVVDRLQRGYIYRWISASGDTIGRERFLTVTPNQNTTYTLMVRDTALRCASGQSPVQTKIAINPDVDIKFFDNNKEVPLSLCEGSEGAQLSFRVYPKYSNGAAAIGGRLGLALFTPDSNLPRQRWNINKADTLIKAWFKPGEYLKYAFIHDTLACDGKTSVVKTAALQIRPFTHEFKAGPDTMLCDDHVARLRLQGALSSAGSPSLKEYLMAKGVAGASSLPETAAAYWTTDQDGLSASEKTSLTPLVNPTGKARYHVWGYNEYGCIQTDSARVERQGVGEVKFDLILPVDSVLCEADSLWFALDRYKGSILSLFDSLVWKRIPAGKNVNDTGQPSGMVNAHDVEILSKDIATNSLYLHVGHGDMVYVDGFISPNSDKVCDKAQSRSAWYRSNKIVVKSFKRPNLVLAQVEKEACVDSLLHLVAQVGENIQVNWLPDPTRQRYEIKGSSGKTVEIKTTSKEPGDVSTTVYAEAYEHPACVAKGNMEIEVKSARHQDLALVPVATRCNNDPVAVALNPGRFENVETWRWIIAEKTGRPRDLTARDFESDDQEVIEDFLSDRLMRFRMPVKSSGVRIWAEGSTTARCVSTQRILSDTVKIEIGKQPLITWNTPLMKDGVPRVLENCAGVALPLEWKLTYSDDLLAAVWNEELKTWQDVNLTLKEEKADSKVYTWNALYPAPKAGEEKGLLRMKVFAYGDGCLATDSLRVWGRSSDTVKVEVATNTTTTVCQGEEVTYALTQRQNVDSVAWYVNGLAVKRGEISTNVSYTYRPNPGDRVWARGYNRTSSCAVYNGVRSEPPLVVDVLSGGRKPVGSLTADLSVSADSVCGAGKVVYSVRGKGFDSVYWYANGALTAVTNLNGGVTTTPDVSVATWQRTPRASTEGLDSVYVVAVRSQRLCADRDTIVSKTVKVARREMPEVKISPRDATAWPGKEVSLTATGASAYLWWTDMERGIAGLASTFEFTMIDDTVGVHVMGYEPAYDSLGLAGGQTPRPAANAYGQFGCNSRDQVTVRPKTVPEGEIRIYIPNTVLLNSSRPADRVFKVFGERIAEVHMRIFNGGGDLVFNKTDKDPVWNPQEATSGNYTYRLVITMKNGEKIEKNGWISVLE